MITGPLRVGLVHVRARQRSYVGVGLLIGVLLGSSLFAAAGGRRTLSAYDRFLRAGHASTIGVSPPRNYDPKVIAALAHLPDVERARTFVGVQTYVMRDGRPDFDEDIEATGTFDGRYYDQDRFKATSGRLPRRNDPGEVAVNELAARAYHLRVGQRLGLGTYGIDQLQRPTFFAAPGAPKRSTVVTIVGIGLFPDEVLQDEGDHTARMLLTPAFTRAVRPWVTYSLEGLVLTHGDADIPALERRVSRILDPTLTDYRVTSVDAFHGRQAVRPLAIALGLFALITALSAAVLGAQALATLIRSQHEDHVVLRGIGAGSSFLWRSALVGPALAIAGGAVVAVALAIATSPLMPIGPVRAVEPTPGFNADWPMLLGGATSAALVMLMISVVVARRQLPGRPPTRTTPVTSRVVRAAIGAGLGPSAVTGLRFAVRRNEAGRAEPTRSAMTGAAVAIAALVCATTFAGSLHRLVSEPRLYGWDWNAAVVAGNGYDHLDVAKTDAIMRTQPDVTAWSGAWFGSTLVGGAETPLLGMRTGQNEVHPPLVSGRLIVNRREIVLGLATAHRLGAHIGDQLRVGQAPTTLTVVGLATFPSLGLVHAAHTSLGVGALVDRTLVPGWNHDITGERTGDFGPNAILVRYRAGTNAPAATNRLRGATKPLSGFAGLDVLADQRPAEIVNARSVGAAPTLLAAALVTASVLSLVLALSAALRRQQHDLAVLRALGFTRRQLSHTLAWQAIAIITVALVVGLPLGIASGRALWRAFADRINVVSVAVSSPTPILLTLLGAIALSAMTALILARLDRSRSVDVLRSTG